MRSDTASLIHEYPASRSVSDAASLRALQTTCDRDHGEFESTSARNRA